MLAWGDDLGMFRKGSYRHKIVEGLRVLPQDNVAKFMKIFGADDGSKTVFEVVRDIPNRDLKNALVIVERSEEKHRKQIQAAAKKYIDDINRAGGDPTFAENLSAVKASVEIAGTDAKNIGHVVTTMNEMSHEIILGAVDDLIKKKSPKNLSWEPTPEEIENFIKSMKNSGDITPNLKELAVSPDGKIGFYGTPPIYTFGNPPKMLSYEFKMARAKISDELDVLKAITMRPGWMDDAPVIPLQRFDDAKGVLYRIPAVERYIPAEVAVIPDIGAIVFRWQSNEKWARVTFGATNVPGLHVVEYGNNRIGQDHEEKFSELSDVTMFVLVKLLDRMYT
jgi:hypothetical protein